MLFFANFRGIFGFPTLYINQSKFNVSTRKPSLLCRPHKRVPTDRSEKRPYAPALKPYIVVDKAQLQKEHFLTWKTVNCIIIYSTLFIGIFVFSKKCYFGQKCNNIYGENCTRVSNLVFVFFKSHFFVAYSLNFKNDSSFFSCSIAIGIFLWKITKQREKMSIFPIPSWEYQFS